MLIRGYKALKSQNYNLHCSDRAQVPSASDTYRGEGTAEHPEYTVSIGEEQF